LSLIVEQKNLSARYIIIKQFPLNCTHIAAFFGSIITHGISIWISALSFVYLIRIYHVFTSFIFIMTLRFLSQWTFMFLLF